MGSVTQYPLLQKPLWSPLKALGYVLQGDCAVCHTVHSIADALAPLAIPCTDARNAKGLYILVCALPVKAVTLFASCVINEEGLT